MNSPRAPLLTLVFALASIGHSAAQGNSQTKAERCAEVREKITALRSKMRQPYSASQGVRYDEKMLKLKKLRRKYCR